LVQLLHFPPLKRFLPELVDLAPLPHSPSSLSQVTQSTSALPVEFQLQQPHLGLQIVQLLFLPMILLPPQPQLVPLPLPAQPTRTNIESMHSAVPQSTT